MLKKPARKTDEVVSGICVHKGKKIEGGTEKTCVTFNPIGEIEIKAYLKKSHGTDKIRACRIQNCGVLFIKGIEGSFYTVVELLVKLLQKN